MVVLAQRSFSVRKHLKTAHPVPVSPRKPTKERILEAADRMFRLHGIWAPIGAIAYHAETDSDTVVKYYGYQERLASLFVKDHIEEAKKTWAFVDAECPTAPDRRL